MHHDSTIATASTPNPLIRQIASVNRNLSIICLQDPKKNPINPIISSAGIHPSYRVASLFTHTHIEKLFSIHFQFGFGGAMDGFAPGHSDARGHLLARICCFFLSPRNKLLLH